MSETMLFEEILDAADQLTDVDSTSSKSLSHLVRQLETLNKDLEQAEAAVKAIKQQRHKIQTENIPDLMGEMGMTRIDVDEVSVTIKPFVSASIPKDRRDEAYQWLRDNGLDDIIKNDVILSFGKDEDTKARDMMLDLEKQGFHPESKTHIHAMTLKAFVKERVEKGLPIDLDMFGAYVAKTAEIKRK